MCGIVSSVEWCVLVGASSDRSGDGGEVHQLRRQWPQQPHPLLPPPPRRPLLHHSVQVLQPEGSRTTGQCCHSIRVQLVLFFEIIYPPIHINISAVLLELWFHHFCQNSNRNKSKYNANKKRNELHLPLLR